MGLSSENIQAGFIEEEGFTGCTGVLQRKEGGPSSEVRGRKFHLLEI